MIHASYERTAADGSPIKRKGDGASSAAAVLSEAIGGRWAGLVAGMTEQERLVVLGAGATVLAATVALGVGAMLRRY